MIPRGFRARSAMLALALLALAPIGSTLAAVSPGSTPGRLGARRGTTVALPRGGPLPDSVLAVVDGDRRITVRDFRNAWKQIVPPARPDSLTPETARQFLELLIGKEALGARALAEKFPPTADESLQIASQRDHLVLQAALDSALRDVQERLLASGDSVTSARALGIAARETLVARLAPRWNEPALERTARAFEALPKPSPDSGLMARIRVLGALPQLDSTARREPLATVPGGPFTAQDLIDSWARVNPLDRPRVAGADQVRDLVKNGLFERELRAAGARRHLERRPDVARQLARQREYLAVQRLVAREVYAKIDTTTAHLERWFEERREDWRLPTRVRLIRLEFPDRRSASALLPKLASRADAETLVSQGLRGGVFYRSDVWEGLDSTLFRQAIAAGPDAVLGPDSTAAGWRVARVEAVLPSRLREFPEARSLVFQRWYGEDGERRMVELLERVRRGTATVVNDRGLSRLVR